MGDNGGNGIVLGGGGARGAYEAGILQGLVEIAPDDGAHVGERGLFDVICGTSVGAINAAWLAAHSDVKNHHIEGLLDHWRSLSLDKHLRPDLMGWLGRTREGVMGKAILDARELERLVQDGVPWDRLRRNVDAGYLRALVVTALHVSSGRTTVFTDLAPGVRYPASKDPRRTHVASHVTSDHVLASAAVPLLFPARRIGQSYYSDGGLRFNTPLAPALRMGVDRVIVIPLMVEKPEPLAEEVYPNAVFLLGKLFDALLLDPIRYDLKVLERMNRFVEVLEEVLTPEEFDRMEAAMTETRGAPYRKVDTLVFRPSADIGMISRRRGEQLMRRGWRGRLVRWMTSLSGGVDADLLSFVLFDREHAEELIALGRRDVLERKDEVRAFFGASDPA